MGKAVGMTILGLITTTFGLLIALFVISFFPDEAITDFAGAVLGAGAAILGAIPDIISFVVSRFTG
ncbi:MAG TPA: hypothetical protein VHM23_24950 [Actinomycetota bacterium]|jgi:hypothetical protein|nr:hypothetical protein [Actinomycetota bacterium]